MPTPMTIWTLEVVDLNGDDVLDLLLAEVPSSATDLTLQMRAVRGRGDGTFEEGELVFVTERWTKARATSLADVDGDGVLDIVAVAHTRTVDVLLVALGAGDGTFGAPQSFPIGVGVRPELLEVADTNGDGTRDAIVVVADLASSGPAGITLLGDGKGRFGGEIVSPLPLSGEIGYRATVIVARDLDGDGYVDLVVWGEEVSSLYGRGDGSFEAPRTLATCGDFQLTWGSFEVADIDADGALDVVVPDTAGICLLRGLGKRRFAPGASIRLGESPARSSSVRAVDVDDDGALDVVIADPADAGFFVAIGSGDGTFAPPEFFPTSIAPRNIALGDLDGDGTRDLVAVDRVAIGVFSGFGDGTFETTSPIFRTSDDAAVSPAELPREYRAGVLVAADLDGDSVPDVVTANPGRGNVSVLRGLGNGSLDAPTPYPAGVPSPTSILAGDLDRDGAVDVLLTDPERQELVILAGDGTGGLTAPLRLPAPGVFQAKVLVDLDGDALLDVVAPTSDGIVILWGRAGLAFESPATIALPSYARDLEVGDLDGDAIPDLVVAIRDLTGSIEIIRGQGARRFQTVHSLRLEERPWDLAARDWNGDGAIDVIAAVSTGSGNAIRLMPGNGDGTLGLPVALAGLPPDASASSIAGADFDGDGILDLAGIRYGVLRVWRGLGAGAFAAAESFAAGPRPEAMIVADLTVDSFPDVVTLSPLFPYYGSSAVFVARNLRTEVRIALLARWPARGHARGRRWLPLSIYGSESLDVRDVDLGSLTLGPAMAEPVGAASFRDLDSDGCEDLMLHFLASQTGIEPRDERGCLTGRTRRGLWIEGCADLDARARARGRWKAAVSPGRRRR